MQTRSLKSSSAKIGSLVAETDSPIIDKKSISTPNDKFEIAAEGAPSSRSYKEPDLAYKVAEMIALPFLFACVTVEFFVDEIRSYHVHFSISRR